MVYERTANALLGVSVTKFRRLVLPVDWVPNPKFSTAPSVPLYDPRVLLETRSFLAKHPDMAKSGSI
jgi:hypothetical protein